MHCHNFNKRLWGGGAGTVPRPRLRAVQLFGETALPFQLHLSPCAGRAAALLLRYVQANISTVQVVSAPALVLRASFSFHFPISAVRSTRNINRCL